MNPPWAEPNLRAVAGDALMPLAAVARPDESSFVRALEVSILGAATTLPDWQPVASETIGPFTLRLLSNPKPERVLVDLVELLDPEHAQAFTERGSESRPCPWNPRARTSDGAFLGHPSFPARRFECGKGDWHFVGVTVIDDQYYRGRRCIWAQPSEKSETVVRFPQVQMGTRVRGYGALSYLLERESKGTPINLEARVDGTSIGTFTHNDREGWRKFEFATDAFNGQPHDLEFRVSSRRSRQREFCFQADIR